VTAAGLHLFCTPTDWHVQMRKWEQSLMHVGTLAWLNHKINERTHAVSSYETRVNSPNKLWWLRYIMIHSHLPTLAFSVPLVIFSWLLKSAKLSAYFTTPYFSHRTNHVSYKFNDRVVPEPWISPHRDVRPENN
jgi:hypothetical protein